MPTFSKFRFLAVLVAAASLTSLVGQDLVYTVGSEYEIQRQNGEKGYVLRRLDKSGYAWETIAVTKISEKNGETVYSDGSGKNYTRLSDGRLAERVTFGASPAAVPDPVPHALPHPVPHALPRLATPAPPTGSTPPFRLMTAPPVVPGSMGRGVTASGNLTLPNGESPLRREKGLIFLTTGMDGKGLRHEVVVQQVAARWYIRTSIADDPNEAPAFRLEDDATVSAYRQLPPGVPQVSRINRGDEATPLVTVVATPPARNEPVEPTADQSTNRPVEYEGRKGHLIGGAGRPRSYLFVDGEPRVVATLESVRGKSNLFTPVGRNDIFVVLDPQGKLSVTDLGGRPASLRDTPAPPKTVAPEAPTAVAPVAVAPAAVAPTAVPPITGDPAAPPVTPPARSVEPAPRLPVPAPPPSYSGLRSGTLQCDGSPIPQNGEHVFLDLPPLKLDLSYDKSTWEATIMENGRTQKVIIRNKKPGAQKKCTVYWKVIP